MLALIRNAYHQVVPNKNEMVLSIAKKVGVLSSMVTSLSEVGVTKEMTEELDRMNSTIDTMLDDVERMIKKTKEKGDIHVLRAVNDMRKQKLLQVNKANALLKPVGTIIG